MRRDDVVVIGAGLAGTFAALAARRAGSSVTVIDEQAAASGYMRWTLSRQEGLDSNFEGKRGFELAQVAWNELYDAGVNVQLQSTAWGLFDDNVIGVVNPKSSYRLKADQIIVATGSTDVAIPFAGWELAGVMTARAALIAMHLHHVLPGRRIGLVGRGPDAAEVQSALEQAGADVALNVSSPSTAGAGGDGRVEWLADGESRVDVDAVLTVHGVQPDAELALQVGVATRYSSRSGAHVPLRSEELESSLPNLYVIGDAAGICTAAEAALEGRVAGIAAAKGRGLEDAMATLADARRRNQASERSGMLPMDVSRVPAHTQVCRCEEIVADSISQAIAGGADTINDVKRRTRAGMGVCQGIFCTQAIAALIHNQAGVPLEDLTPMTARPPARLVTLAQIAASGE